MQINSTYNSMEMHIVFVKFLKDIKIYRMQYNINYGWQTRKKYTKIQLRSAFMRDFLFFYF